MLIRFVCLSLVKQAGEGAPDLPGPSAGLEVHEGTEEEGEKDSLHPQSQKVKDV